MVHYLIELALWILAAYFLGCLLGWGLRNLFGSVEQPVAIPREVAAPEARAPITTAYAPSAVPVKPRSAPAAVPVAVAAAVVAAPAHVGKMGRPKGIAAARGGKADNLQRISGVGPKSEPILHNLGFFHFDQIAAWTASQVDWVDDHLGFDGRIKREEWIKQAALLAAGNETEFKRLYGTGGLKNAKGEIVAGTRTTKQ